MLYPYMYMATEAVAKGLTVKTTILFSPDLHDRLARLADKGGVSVGELVRRACEREYSIASRQERIQAIRELAALSLPVDDVAVMKRESVPSPEDLMP